MAEKTTYIKLYRSILGWEWYKDQNTKSLFLHFLLKANTADQKFKGIEIKRGQFISSLKNLSNETGLSIREVRTALEHLILTQEVTKSITSKFTLFTVLNYEKFQSVDTDFDKQATSDRQRYKNDKNIKNEKKDIKEKKKEIYKERKKEKHKHGNHKNVLLTDDEYLKLKERYPTDYDEKINKLSEGIELKGYKYKSHYLAVIKWANNDNAKEVKSEDITRYGGTYL